MLRECSWPGESAATPVTAGPATIVALVCTAYLVYAVLFPLVKAWWDAFRGV